MTYELKETDVPGFFTFVTRYNVPYVIGISDYSDWFGLPSKEFPNNKGMCIAIQQLNENIRAPFDSRIRATVTAFILDYLEHSSDDFFFYACSDMGGKENQRRHAFNRWFETSGKSSSIQKTWRMLEDQEIHFLYREDRPAIAQLFGKIDLYNALPNFLVKS